MTRQDIEKASVDFYGHKYQYATRKAFIRGAEWMDEQYTKICVMETSNTDNASDKDLIEECERRGIFVRLRNELTEKMQQWAEDWFCNGEEWMRRTDFIDGIKEDIRRAMEGGRQ